MNNDFDLTHITTTTKADISSIGEPGILSVSDPLAHTWVGDTISDSYSIPGVTSEHIEQIYTQIYGVGGDVVAGKNVSPILADMINAL